MFLVKANTKLLVHAPFGRCGGKQSVVTNGYEYFDHEPWKGYVTKEDKVYEKHEVIDVVAVYNQREDVKPWMTWHTDRGYALLVRDGKYASVKMSDLKYLV